MRIKNLILFLAILIVQVTTIFSQTETELSEKAVYYYKIGEYQIAIPYLSKLIEKNPCNLLYFKQRGNCYLETGQHQKAIQDYKFVLKQKPESDIFFNLGIIYEKENMPDSAFYFFHKFVQLEPKQADGYIRLSLLFMYYGDVYGDSAVYFAQKAVAVDPGNANTLNYLALAYYSKNQYDNSLETAIMGLRFDSCSSVLYQSAGMSSFFKRDFNMAIEYFDKAFYYDHNDYSLLDFKIQAMLLLNTKPETYVLNSEKGINFTNLTSENLKKTKAIFSDKKSNISYKSLLHKLNFTPLSMSLDEFHLLYVAYSMNTEAYQAKNENVMPETNINLLNELGKLEEKLITNPVNFPLYLELAEVYLELENFDKYFENRFKYYGFIESIKATGNGISPETAYVINNKEHELAIMNSLGYRIKSQTTKKIKSQNYDLLVGKDSNNADITVFFNTDLCPMTADIKTKVVKK